MDCSPTVMIVDDDAALCKALKVRLEAAGFRTVTTTHPDEASRIVLKIQPDVILLDVNMPRYTGLEFHECLQFTKRGREIPIVYLTGERSEVFRHTALKQGARAFLNKPYDAERVIETIRGVIGDRAERCTSASAR